MDTQLPLNNIKILIGSCGGLTGYYLTKIIKKYYPEYTVIGFDSNNAMATGILLDEFYQAPVSSNESEFLDFLIKLLNDKAIDYYFPTHSKETYVVSKHETEVQAKVKAKFLISPFNTYEELNNKDRCNNNLKRIGVPVPQIYKTRNTIKFPAFLKPVCGSGAKNTFIINNIKEYDSFISLYPKLVCMEYIDGTEYTVDAAFDKEGHLVSYNQRIRVKQLGGATIFTYNDYTVDVKPFIVKISNYFKFIGAVNFQFILRDSVPYFTDINLRYASGGFPLAVESGMKFPQMFIDIMDGKNLNEKDYPMNRKKIIMFRHFDEEFVQS